MSSLIAPSVAHAPRFVTRLNPIMQRVMGTGLPAGPNVLLTVRGRSSGRPHTFPVALLEAEGRRFVMSPYGEVNWVRNLRAAGEAVLTRGRETSTVEALELDAMEGGRVLREATAPYARSWLGARLLRLFYGFRPGATAEAYVEEVRGHPMFELRPSTAPAAHEALAGS